MIAFDNALVVAIREVTEAVTEGREPADPAMALVQEALGIGNEIMSWIVSGDGPQQAAANIRTLNVDELRLALFERVFATAGIGLERMEEGS